MFLYNIADPISNQCKIANDRMAFCPVGSINIAEDKNNKIGTQTTKITTVKSLI